VSEARARLDEAGRALREEQRIALDLPDTQVPAGRNLFVGEGMQVRHGDRPVFADGGIDLTVRGPERIALTGPNGAGKSTLLRLVTGDLAPDGGEIRRNDGRIAYLSQRLDLLDLDRTVAQNFASFAPHRPEAERMNLLARFLFRGAGAQLPVGVLSGGERLRATLACVLCAEPAPQLLLLDEPTNNLDLVSAGQLESALSSYQGAFIVVSHDERFLAEIGVNRWLQLANGVLKETAAPTV
uniref:ATP-binding cassette domain-containing protein n=1 Tax=Peterkaempfera griseoplana TaxID=66896 RepID=UPI000A68C282